MSFENMNMAGAAAAAQQQVSWEQGYNDTALAPPPPPAPGDQYAGLDSRPQYEITAAAATEAQYAATFSDPRRAVGGIAAVRTVEPARPGKPEVYAPEGLFPQLIGGSEATIRGMRAARATNAQIILELKRLQRRQECLMTGQPFDDES